MRFLYAPRQARVRARPERRRRRADRPERCPLSKGKRSSRSSPGATWRRKPPLLSWVNDEGRHPSRVRPGDRSLRLRQRVPDALDEARAARRDLLELPPVLHGQAEARSTRAAGWSASSAASRRPAARPSYAMSQPIGGREAVLEGVMMRGSSNWAVAVRKPDGQIAEVSPPDRVRDEAALAVSVAGDPRHHRAGRVPRRSAFARSRSRPSTRRKKRSGR